MEVRPCTADDVAALASLWPTPADVHVAHFTAQRGGRSTYLVAWQGEEPVGSVVVRWRGCVGASAHATYPGTVELNHLQVRDGWRGRGAGSLLLRSAEALVQDRDGGQVAVSVADDDAAAARLYLRLGYRRTGVHDVCEYDWVADDGSVRHAVERSELLVKELGAVSHGEG